MYHPHLSHFYWQIIIQPDFLLTLFNFNCIDGKSKTLYHINIHKQYHKKDDIKIYEMTHLKTEFHFFCLVINPSLAQYKKKYKKVLRHKEIKFRRKRVERGVR